MMETQTNASRVAQLLDNLPNSSSGCLQHVVPGRTVTVAPITYVAQTSQRKQPVLVQSDRSNLLVHCLIRQREKETREKLQQKKRPGGAPQEGASGSAPLTGTKRPRAQLYTLLDLKAFTKEELVTLLRERGAPVKGKKEELIARVLELQKSSTTRS